MGGKGKKFMSMHAPPPPPTDRPPLITMEQLQAKRNSIIKNRALQDADKAEQIALDLLALCADTTDHLSALARGEQKVESTIDSLRKSLGRSRSRGMSWSTIASGGAGGADEALFTTSGSASSGVNASLSNLNPISGGGGVIQQDRVSLIQKNGLKFQHALKKIHDLLAPHANLVVNYSRETEFRVNQQELLAKKKQEESNANIASSSAAPDDDEAGTSEMDDATSNANANADDSGVDLEVDLDDKEKKNRMDTDESKDKDDESSKDYTNMYSSRLEMKLAIDRRNLLQDMLRLEKRHGSATNNDQGDRRQDSSIKGEEESSSSLLKRKRQD
jgi:hypothetical protein